MNNEWPRRTPKVACCVFYFYIHFLFIYSFIHSYINTPCFIDDRFKELSVVMKVVQALSEIDTDIKLFEDQIREEEESEAVQQEQQGNTSAAAAAAAAAGNEERTNTKKNKSTTTASTFLNEFLQCKFEFETQLSELLSNGF